MEKAPIPKNEKERLVSLHNLGLLDTQSEERFDQITRTATKIFHVPISTLTLVDAKREWFKSCQGLLEHEGDRAISFCGHALLSDEILVIPDTQKDVRFSDNPMVIGKPFIRFYAGVPIMSADGQRVGVFCIKDTQLRTFSKQDEEILVGLAAWAQLEINSRNLSLALKEIEEERVKEGVILENLGEGVLAVDSERKVLFINKAGEDLLGWKGEGLVGEVINSLPLEDVEGRPIPLEKRPTYIAMKEARSVVGNYLFVRNDGTRIALGTNVAPIVLKGETIGAIATFRNITKEREVEKLRTDFLSLASHQLRTPLSGTKWLIETLSRNILGPVTKKQKEYLNQIYQINERMIKLVFDMLNVLNLESSSATARKEMVSILKLYDEATLMMEPVAKSKGVTLHNALRNHKEVMIETDIQMLRSILECFISNAINYSSSGQKVILDVEEENTVSVFLVRDSGIGIPKAEQNRIFERFYRASNAKIFKPEGTGLGLYIASMLAEKIGAKISFESEEGKGSTFYLRVPKTVEKIT